MNDSVRTIISPIITRIQQLAALRVADTTKPIPIVAIAGGPGAGKSYFAQKLQEFLCDKGLTAVIVEQDNFLLYNETGFETLAINPRLKWQQLHTALQEITAGKSHVKLPFRNKTVRPFVTEYRTIDFSHVDVVLFDGKYALSGPETFNFFSHCALGIFMLAPEPAMIEWKTERELARPQAIQKEKDLFDDRLAWGIKMYKKYILPTQKNATFIITVDEHHAYSLHEEHRHDSN